MAFLAHGRSWLACGAALLLGLALGWQLGGAAALDEAPARPMTPPSAGERQVLAPAAEAAALRPRDDGGLARRESARREDAAPSSPLAAEGALAEQRPVASASLLEDLRAFLRSGVLEGEIAENPSAVLRLLAVQYLHAERPGEALELLRRHPVDDASLYHRIGQALLEAGDRPAATEAFLAVLERQPFEPDAIEELCDLDPAGALALFDAKAAEFGVAPNAPLVMQRARLLAALGRKDEALALVDAALSDGFVHPDVLAALTAIDPAEAERRLRAGQATDESGLLALELARLVAKDAARKAEALALLEELLDRAPQRSEALELLADLDPERLVTRIDGAAADETDPWLWSRVGDALLERGREADAVEAWMKSIEGDASNGEAIAHLLERAPARLWSHFQAAVVNTQDDELLGDVADFYWAQDRRPEAIELWRRANRIDPTDDEWTGKLRLALAGLDPL